MNDERFLKDWLQDTTSSTTDPGIEADKVVAHITEIPQRRRWLPWPPARRLRNEHAPTIRRNPFMFSPTQALAAVALAVAVGGTLLLSAQDTAPDEIVLAADRPAEAQPLAVDLDFVEQPFFGESTTLPNGSIRTTGVALVNEVLEASDPRFEGTATITQAVDLHDGVEVVIGAWRIENDGGAWQGLPFFAMEGASNNVAPGTTDEFVLVGEAGYEGYIAIVQSTVRPEAEEVGGVIIEPPDAPDYRLEGFVLNTTALPEAPAAWSPSAE